MPHQTINLSDDEARFKQLVSMHPDDLRALKFGSVEQLRSIISGREPTLCDQCRNGPSSVRPVKAP